MQSLQRLKGGVNAPLRIFCNLLKHLSFHHFRSELSGDKLSARSGICARNISQGYAESLTAPLLPTGDEEKSDWAVAQAIVPFTLHTRLAWMVNT